MPEQPKDDLWVKIEEIPIENELDEAGDPTFLPATMTAMTPEEIEQAKLEDMEREQAEGEWADTEETADAKEASHERMKSLATINRLSALLSAATEANTQLIEVADKFQKEHYRAALREGVAAGFRMTAACFGSKPLDPLVAAGEMDSMEARVLESFEWSRFRVTCSACHGSTAKVGCVVCEGTGWYGCADKLPPPPPDAVLEPTAEPFPGRCTARRESVGGFPCTLTDGHDGQHVAQFADGTEAARWGRT